MTLHWNGSGHFFTADDRLWTPMELCRMKLPWPTAFRRGLSPDDTLHVVHFPSWERSPSTWSTSPLLRRWHPTVCDIWSKSGNWWKGHSYTDDLVPCWYSSMDGKEFHETQWWHVWIPHNFFTQHEEQDQLHGPPSWQCVCLSYGKRRNLGVYFDQSMKMDRHISQVCQTAYFQLRNIAAIRPLLTRKAAESLIHSLISSRLDFCNCLLAGLPSATLNRLQAVQNAAARLLTGLRKHDHISPVLAELHWLPVKSKIEFKVLLLTFKAIHGVLLQKRHHSEYHYSEGLHVHLQVQVQKMKWFSSFQKFVTVLYTKYHIITPAVAELAQWGAKVFNYFIPTWVSIYTSPGWRLENGKCRLMSCQRTPMPRRGSNREPWRSTVRWRPLDHNTSPLWYMILFHFRNN